MSYKQAVLSRLKIGAVKRRVSLKIAVLTGAMYAAAARASGSGMPWESPLQSLLNSIAGPVAKVIGAIVIIATGLTIAFGEGGAGMRKLLWVVFGLSIAFTAVSFWLSFLGYGGGLAI